MEPAFIYSTMSAVFVAGTTIGYIKKTLNGTTERVKEIQSSLNNHIAEESDNDTETHERIAKVETKVDLIIHGFKK